MSANPSPDRADVAGRKAGYQHWSAGALPRVAWRDLLLVGLTMVSACIDAISYLGLGRVFPANMTGNTVLLSISLANGADAAALRSATALGMFVVGAAMLGAAVPERVSTRGFRAVLLAQVVLASGFCGGWVANGSATPDGALRYGLIAAAGAMMGLQSGLVRHLGAPVSTTYLTGTWTSLSAGVARRIRRAPAAEPSSVLAVEDRSKTLQAVVVSAYLAMAYGAAVTYRHVGAWATAIPLGLVVLVTVAAAIRVDLP